MWDGQGINYIVRARSLQESLGGTGVKLCIREAHDWCSGPNDLRKNRLIIRVYYGLGFCLLLPDL